MRRLGPLLSFVLCLLAAASTAAAQDDAGAGAGPRKELRAYRITGNAPEIDGNIEDEVWLAAGSIDDFTQQEPDNIAAPRERTVVQVAYEDPDFNRKSIRGNIVLRWEYVRGSTLFLVWNISTSDETRAGPAFGAPGNHVFVVKTNYWLSL
jgi:hypothetical protein